MAPQRKNELLSAYIRIAGPNDLNSEMPRIWLIQLSKFAKENPCLEAESFAKKSDAKFLRHLLCCIDKDVQSIA